MVSASRRRAAGAYLVTTFLSSLGSAAALLGSTIVSSDAGASGGQAATYTGLMLALNYGTAAVTTPYSSRVGHRFGPRRALGLVLVGFVVVYGVLASGIALGLPAFPLLMVITPFLGALNGLTRALFPPTMRAYLAGDLATAETKSSVSSGFAWVLGALGGAVIIDQVGPAAAFAADALLTLPLAVVILAVAPATDITAPRALPHPWRSVVSSLRSNGRLVRASLLGVATAILIAPLGSLVVPLTREMDHDLAIHAGIILACIAAGAMLSPLPLRALGTRWGPLRASAGSYALAGVALLVISLVAVWLSHTPQLVAFGAFGVVYGATSVAGGNLLVADAGDAVEVETQQEEILAAYFLVVGLATPIGTSLWGRLTDVVPVGGMLAILAGSALVLIGLGIWDMNRRHLHAAPAVRPAPRRAPVDPHRWHLHLWQ